jgi:hypothetical protein
VQELKGYFDADHAEVIRLKAANDNVVSETTALRADLKSANDNHAKDRADLDRVMKELHDLKNGVGFKRAVGQ